MKRVGPILDETIMDILSSGCVHTVGSVKTMEDMGLYSGFALYRYGKSNSSLIIVSFREELSFLFNS